jgi:hypothetical protein
MHSVVCGGIKPCQPLALNTAIKLQRQRPMLFLPQKISIGPGCDEWRVSLCPCIAQQPPSSEAMHSHAGTSCAQEDMQFSPDFLHFVGLHRGRHSGLPYGVAKVTHLRTYTESLSHGAQTFGGSKIARMPEMCRGQLTTVQALR